MVTLFPLHFFFAFLYYTDVGSTLFVLAAYLVRTAVHINSLPPSGLVEGQRLAQVPSQYR